MRSQATMMRDEIIKGYLILDSHGRTQRTELAVVLRDDGLWWCGDMPVIAQEGDDLPAEHEAWAKPSLTGVALAGERGGFFVPDKGECERIGMPIEYLKDIEKGTPSVVY